MSTIPRKRRGPRPRGSKGGRATADRRSRRAQLIGDESRAQFGAKFRERVRERIQKLGGQAAVERESGFPQPLLSEYIGGTIPGAHALKRLAIALHVSPGWLLDYEVVQPTPEVAKLKRLAHHLRQHLAQQLTSALQKEIDRLRIAKSQHAPVGQIIENLLPSPDRLLAEVTANYVPGMRRDVSLAAIAGTLRSASVAWASRLD